MHIRHVAQGSDGCGYGFVVDECSLALFLVLLHDVRKDRCEFGAIGREDFVLWRRVLNVVTVLVRVFRVPVCCESDCLLRNLRWDWWRRHGAAGLLCSVFICFCLAGTCWKGWMVRTKLHEVGVNEVHCMLTIVSSANICRSICMLLRDVNRSGASCRRHVETV